MVPLEDVVVMELRHPFRAHLLPTAVEVVHMVDAMELEVVVAVAMATNSAPTQGRQTRAAVVAAAVARPLGEMVVPAS